MRHDRIKTSHDLADLLEDAARALRMLPPLELSDAQRSIAADSFKDAKRKDIDRDLVQERLTLLADQLPDLSRSEAETHLASLTVESIRQLAPLVDVRMPSKATKHEYVQLLLTQLFDAPAGQEVIRTFHKRSGKTAMSKSPAASRGDRRVPGGEDRNNEAGKLSRRSDSASTIQ